MNQSSKLKLLRNLKNIEIILTIFKKVLRLS